MICCLMVGLAETVLGLAEPFQYLPAPVESASAAGILGKPNVGGNIVDLRNRSIPLGLGLATVAAAQVVKGREGQGGKLVRTC